MVKTTCKQQENFELTSRTFVWHVNLSLTNNQTTIFWIPVDNCVQNLYIQSNEDLLWQTIAAREQLIFTIA
jgi:hypothetical protein